MPVYDKLVRDRIPEIIERTGKTCTTRILNEEEYVAALLEKFNEELLEYREAGNRKERLEELSDLLEILNALSHLEDSDLHDLEALRIQKAAKRGAFDQKILLLEVQD